MTKQTYTNANSAKDSCPKCGNPNKMYFCNECETNQEYKGECRMCGHANGVSYVVVLDEEYHEECN